MGIVINTLSGLSKKILVFTYNRTQRQRDRNNCARHKSEWIPLTAEERRTVDKKDICAYTIFKNMTGESELLRYFVPGALYKTQLLPRLNSANHTTDGTGLDSIFSDKNYAELFMPQLQFPVVLVRRVDGVFYDSNFREISSDDALQRLQPYEKLVFKQSVDSGHGLGIRLVSREDYSSTLLPFSLDYMIQPVVHQHPALAYFNESSVNILRITTLIHKGEVYVLGGILRIGPPGCFFDHGVYNGIHYLNVGIKPDGTLYSKAHDVDNCVSYDTVFGKPIQGRIPRYEEITALLKQAHIRYPQYRIIGWDMTLDDRENIICMEFNTLWPGLFGSQCCLGPIFAQKTPSGKRLLDELL